MQKMESKLIFKLKTKLMVQNFFHIKSDSDGCPSNIIKWFSANVWSLLLPFMQIQVTFKIVYIINIPWPKFMTKRNRRKQEEVVF